MPVSRYRIYTSEKTKSFNTPMEDSNKAEETEEVPGSSAQGGREGRTNLYLSLPLALPSNLNTRRRGLLINNKKEFKQSNSQCGKFPRTNDRTHS